MRPVVVVDKQRDFDTLMGKLSKQSYLAFDTESNSFYVYYERVCLIQISTLEDDYIVDPFALSNVDALGDILADQRIEKVFHAASNDVLGLKRDYRFKIQNIFDTAIAAKMLGYKQLGLARLLEEHFGVLLNKKWQRYDWGKRPLRPEQLDYARLDTHFLIELRHKLETELTKMQLLEMARDAFNRASEQEFQERTFHPEGFTQINGAQSLDPVGRRILKALYLFRDHEARRRNRAPFRVIPNDTLVLLALSRPKDVKDISKIKGFPRPFCNSRAARNIVDVIRKMEDFGDDLQLKS